jgi:hypothetical protein
MPFQRDEKYAAEVRSVFGEYLTTFVSEPRGQVRADIFQKKNRVVAYVSFPTGISASEVTEPYVSALWDYAREEGVADRFQLILSSN